MLKLVLHFVSWIKRVWRWVLEGEAVIAGVLAITCALLFAFYPAATQTAINRSGYGLQILGMMLAIRGLLHIRSHFELPSLLSLFKDWGYGFPRWRRDLHLNAESTEINTKTGRAAITHWSPDDKSLPIADRLNEVVKNVERIRKSQIDEQERVDNLEQLHEAQMEELTNKAKQSEATIKSNLERLHSEGMLEALMGLILLTIGITLSTLSNELATLLT
ncbi:MAG: hypothetical protein V7742_11365 [Halioglobus sp.]